MDGVATLVQLASASAAVTALVPAERIMGGVLPQGCALPAIGVTSISRTDRHTLPKGGQVHCRERVQVTVLAASYESQKAVLRALVGACDGQFPAVAGIANVTVHTDSAGPDFMSADSSIHAGSQDFVITYSQGR